MPERAVDWEARLQALDAMFDAHFTRLEGDLRLLKWRLGVLLAGVASLVLKAFFT